MTTGTASEAVAAEQPSWATQHDSILMNITNRLAGIRERLSIINEKFYGPRPPDASINESETGPGFLEQFNSRMNLIDETITHIEDEIPQLEMLG